MADKIRMFDIHCHCLFGMDDGSQSLEMSLEMLKMAREQGVTDVVCSSHSWGKLEDYEENFSTLQKAVVENNIPIKLLSHVSSLYLRFCAINSFELSLFCTGTYRSSVRGIGCI